MSIKCRFCALTLAIFFVNNYIVRSGMYVFVASVLNGEGGGQTDRKGIVTSFLSKNSRGDPSVHPVHELNSSVQTSTTIDY